MGANPLDKEDEFWNDMEDVVFLCIKKDKTINMKTSVKDMDELKSIFSTAFMMALFHDMKRNPTDLDKLH
jgi:hypothetical protein